MKIYLIPVFLFGLCQVCAATLSVNEPKNFAMRVIDANGDPVLNFKVKGGEVSDQFVQVTDEDGIFTAKRDRYVSWLDLEIVAEGYRNQQVKLAPLSVEGENPTTVVMQKRELIHGVITDMEGQPREGVLVSLAYSYRVEFRNMSWAVVSSSSNSDITKIQTVTDKAGSFEFPKPPIRQSSVIFVSGDSVGLSAFPLSSIRMEQDAPLQFKVPGGTTLRVQAHPEHVPALTRLSLRNKKNPHLVCEGRFEPPTGSYDFEGIAPGDYKLTANADPGYPTPHQILPDTHFRQTIDVLVGGREQPLVKVGFEDRITFKGRLFFGEKLATAAAVYLSNSDLTLRRHQETDAEGGFVFEDLPAGTYDLVAFREEVPFRHFLIVNHPNRVQLELTEDTQQDIKLAALSKLILQPEKGASLPFLSHLESDKHSIGLMGSSKVIYDVPPGEYKLFNGDNRIKAGIVVPDDGSDVYLSDWDPLHAKASVTLVGTFSEKNHIILFDGHRLIYSKEVEGAGPHLLTDLPLGSAQMTASTRGKPVSGAKLLPVNFNAQTTPELILELQPTTVVFFKNEFRVKLTSLEIEHIESEQKIIADLENNMNVFKPRTGFLIGTDYVAYARGIKPGKWEVVATFEDGGKVSTEINVIVGEMMTHDLVQASEGTQAKL